MAGEHSMDESFRMADVDVIVVLAAWDSKDKQEVVHNKWKARVGKHLGTNTLLVIADQVGQQAGVPFAASSAVDSFSRGMVPCSTQDTMPSVVRWPA